MWYIYIVESYQQLKMNFQVNGWKFFLKNIMLRNVTPNQKETNMVCTPLFVNVSFDRQVVMPIATKVRCREGLMRRKGVRNGKQKTAIQQTMKGGLDGSIKQGGDRKKGMNREISGETVKLRVILLVLQKVNSIGAPKMYAYMKVI